jgi:hypothetical protein
MIPLAEMVLAVAWTFGANGFLIERQMAGTRDLPAAWLAPVGRRVEVAFHDRDDWAMAFYLTGRASGAAAGGAAPPPAAAESAPPNPGPRIVLYAPYYLAPGGLAPPSAMAVDVAEYYFHALLEAALDLELEASGSPYAAWAEARAAELMTAVPPSQRSAVYASALADFGAHLLSIRNELTRVAERHAAGGRDVCLTLDQPASLFGLWRRSFAGGSYPGGTFVQDGAGTPRWTEGRQPLERVDKQRFVAELLGAGWVGEPRLDFGALCDVQR